MAKDNPPSYQKLSLDELATLDPPFGGNFAKIIKGSYRWKSTRPPENPEDSHVLDYEASLSQNRNALLQR